jgi:hypothetical protein
MNKLQLPTAVVLLAAACAGALIARAQAQTEVALQPQSAGPATGANDGGNVGQSRRLQRLAGPDGRPLPFPDAATLEAFQEWMAKRDSPPGVTISRLSITGQSLSDRARLAVTIEARVVEEEEWVALPLEMAEGDLTGEPTYEGSGEALPAPFDEERGYQWWLKGRGRHTLRFELLAPLRVQGAQRRLQLALPPSTVSVCSLVVPYPKVSAKAPERTTLAVKPLASESTIEAVGIGRRLDLAWQPQPEAAVGVAPLEVACSINVALVDAEWAAIEASQSIQSIGQQGAFERMTVTLPQNAELLRIEGAEYGSHQFDPSAPARVVIQLKRPTEGPIDLRYALRKRLPELGKPVLIDGFDVQEAAVQNGFVALQAVGGVRVLHDGPLDRYAQRIHVAELPAALRQPQTAQAYRFIRRMKLNMLLERVLPLVNADVAYLAYCRADRIELDAHFRLNILRTGLQRLTVNWPGWKQSGWGLPALEVAGFSEARLTESVADPDRLEIDLAAPVKGAVSLRLRSRLPAPQPGQPAEYALPAVASAGTAGLTIIHAENLRVQLHADAAPTIRPAPGVEPAVPRELATLPRHDYVIDGASPRLALTSHLLPREVTSSTRALVRLKAGVAQVRQFMTFQVSNEPVAELVLRVPGALADQRIEFDEGKVRRRVDAASGQTMLMVEVNPPRTGEIQLQARFDATQPGATAEHDTAQISIPLLQPDPFAFQTTELHFSDAAGRAASIADQAWRPLSAPPGTLAWQFDGADHEVPLLLSRGTPGAPGHGIDRLVIHCALAANGARHCRVQFQAAAQLEEIPLELPEGLRPAAAWCDGRAVELAHAVVRPGMVILRNPVGASRAATWTIDTVNANVAPLRLGGRVSWQTPRLPQAWQPQETIWVVSLPQNGYLLDVPQGLSPAYRWEFSGGWQRRLAADVDALLPGTGAPAQIVEEDSHRYVLRSSDGGALLSVLVISRLAMVAVTTGVGLVGVLLLVHLPWLANSRMLAFLALAASMAAVWYSEPLLVLMQPVALGGVLAAFYFAVDRLAKARRRREAAISSGSAILALSSSQAPALGAGIGSNEFTSARAPAVVGDAAGALSESGSRA